jgi:hypothetical protein
MNFDGATSVLGGARIGFRLSGAGVIIGWELKGPGVSIYELDNIGFELCGGRGGECEGPAGGRV